MIRFLGMRLLRVDLIYFDQLPFEMGVVTSPRKLFPNWMKVSLRTTQIGKLNSNEPMKNSSEQMLHFPLRYCMVLHGEQIYYKWSYSKWLYILPCPYCHTSIYFIFGTLFSLNLTRYLLLH